MSSTTAKTEAQIILDEARQILSRREKVFPPSEVAAFKAHFDSETNSAAENKENFIDKRKRVYDGPPVGLAISGGGIRSASTALGLIQSLYRTGLLRFVDYLSTVSGGTYTGALLAAQIHSQSKPIDFTPEDPPASLDSCPLPLLHTHRTGQPEIVRGLSTAAESLKRPLVFLSRHLWGLLAVNAFLLSGLVAVTAGLAWLFRSLDHPTSMLHLAELGFQTDLARAMFPAAVAFLVWAGTAVISAHYGRRLIRFPPISAYAYGVLLITLALGVVLLFSTANLDVSQLEIWLDRDSDFGNRIRSVLGTLGRVLTVVLAVAITPLFRIHDIVRSGTSGTRVERWIFNLVSTTAIFGIPLVLFYFLSAENISGYVESKNGLRITRGSLRDKDRFLETLTDDVRNNNPRENLDIDEFLKEFPVLVSAALLPKTTDSAAEPKPTEPAASENSRSSPQVNDQPSGETAVPGSESPDQHQQPGNSSKVRLNHQAREEALKPLKTKVERIRHLELEVRKRNKRCQWFPLTIWTYLTDDPPPDFENSIHLRAEYRDELDNLAKAINTSLSILDHEVDDEERQSKDRWDVLFTGNSSSVNATEPHRVASTPPIFDTSAQSTLPSEKNTPFKSYRNRHKALMGVLDSLDDAPESKNKLISDIRKLRWQMMQVAFGDDLLYSPKEVFAAVVNEPDQATRARIFFWACGLFVGLGLVFSVNTTTNHGFYRDQLASRWIAPHSNVGDSLALCDLKTTDHGGPLLIINNTVNLGGRQANASDNKLARMILTPGYTGCERLGFRETRDLLGTSYTLADATALSGAAVSPLAAENVLARALLIITNFRLGQWLPNPNPRRIQNGLAYPKPLVLLWQHFFCAPDEREFLFVSDGGHHENTGIESLLVRRCRLIIAADFSEDGNYELGDFRKLCLRASEQLGVQLVGQPAPYSARDLIPGKDESRVRSHLAVFKILYPRPETGPDDGGEGWLILVKPGLSGNEPAGLLECERNFAKFPHDPTGDQLFEETRFMAYRQLGEHLGEELFRFLSAKTRAEACEVLPAAGLVDAAPEYEPDPIWLSKHWRPYWVSAPAAPAEAQKGTKSTKKPLSGKLHTATKSPVQSPLPTSTADPLPGDQ